MAVERIADDGCSLLLPRRSLADCIFAAVVRDTRGLALAPDQRVNYFPAAPFCAISLFFEGQSIMVTDQSLSGGCAASSEPLPPEVFSGPHGAPSVSMNPGPVHVMSIGLYPEAVQELTGIDIGRWRDRIVPAETVLPPSLLASCRAARAAGSATEAFERFQDGLDPMWRSTRPKMGAPSLWLHDWSHHLLRKAATTGVGRSLRQIERRMRTWTGQSGRDLASLGRLEVAFAAVTPNLADDREDWSQLAVASGFSDQSHFVREVRRSTGFSPAKLRQRIKVEPAFWYYRLIGEIY